MVANPSSSLVRLSDSDLTLKDPVEDIRGFTVLDRSGDDIGEVDDLLIDDREHKVRFLQVASGGFLGLGSKKFLIPVDAITRINANMVHVDQTSGHVVGAPDYDPLVIPEHSYYEDLYGHYGYSPYWTEDYRYPRFPYY